MTNEELTELIAKLNQRMDLMSQALDLLRKMVELDSDRIENIQNKLFGLYPPKEP